MTITIRHLEQIVALNKLKSFAKASRHLHISQPALSRSLSTLEDQLGIKIFDRLHGNISPTVFGEQILQKGILVLQDMRVLHEDLNLLQEVQKGEINIGCGPFPAETFIGDSLAAFHAIHPNININVTVDMTPRLLSLLKERVLDLFVADTRSILKEHNLNITSLDQQQAYFCCRTSHPLVSRQSPTVQEILDFPVALMWVPDDIVSLLSEMSSMKLSKMSDLSQGVIQCNNFKILLSIISTTDAIGIVSQKVVSRSIYKDDITLLPLKFPNFKTQYGIVENKRYSKSPAVKLLHFKIIKAAETYC